MEGAMGYGENTWGDMEMKKRWQDELRERLEKKKRKQGTAQPEEEKRMEHNNLPRPEDKQVTRDEYFEEIIKLYRHHTNRLTASNIDYLVMVEWWDEGIPLRVVKIGINEVMRNYYMKQGIDTSKIRGLSYFKQAVESAWEDYKETRIGAH